MKNEALTRATKSLNIVTRELRDAMDDTQEMYHELFVRMLHVHNTLQTILGKLKDAKLEGLDQKQGEYAEKT